jgi:hypothetical protein
VLLVLAFSFYTGARGVDFGSMWDERALTYEVEQSLDTGRLLPDRYNYPSLAYALTLGSTVLLNPPQSSKFLGEYFSAIPFDYKAHLRLRLVFLFVSLLAVLWTYLAAFVWTERVLPATCAAALLASSWEVQYHSRWIAPDGLLMQFGALTLLTLALSMKRPAHRFGWLCASAVGAGLACGSKYPGGALLLPVLLAQFYRSPKPPADVAPDTGSTVYRVVLRSCALIALFALAFLASTPGALLETGKFISNVRFEVGHYSAGTQAHREYVVPDALTHVARLVEYATLVLPSRFPAISLCVSALALLGLLSLVKSDRRATLILFSGPCFYALAMSQQAIMIVRNYMLLAPFVAIAAALAFDRLVKLLPGRPARLFKFALALLIVIDFGWLYTAAESIAHRKELDHRALLLEHLSQQPETSFMFSPGAWRLVAGTLPANAQGPRSDPTRSRRYVFLSDEPRGPHEARASNRAWTYEQVSGPLEVNFGYYATWGITLASFAEAPGRRVLSIPMSEAIEMRMVQ